MGSPTTSFHRTFHTYFQVLFSDSIDAAGHFEASSPSTFQILSTIDLTFLSPSPPADRRSFKSPYFSYCHQDDVAQHVMQQNSEQVILFQMRRKRSHCKILLFGKWRGLHLGSPRAEELSKPRVRHVEGVPSLIPAPTQVQPSQRPKLTAKQTATATGVKLRLVSESYNIL